MSANSDEQQRREDDQRARDIIREHSKGYALRPPNFGNKKVITVKLSSVALDGLRETATRLGYVFNGKGNVSMLIEAIGTGTIKVRNDYND